ncbi:AmmeMemoRadiSam system protein A [Actinomyces slackii]|uniref:Uncharacterized conserved protein n=1 Tax=Actinomyces slackii TaxID=52774 RepID=A0A3S4WLG9_9ACTO|nr:AmmeMemoRadiSam system protein A [Actinomyces slackii]VEG75505.1 Uncharacterized conserved protein [Actinomyces slackii]
MTSAPTSVPRLPPDAGLVLLPLARGAIARRLGLPHPALAEDAAEHSAEGAAWLRPSGASFVTLTSGRAPGGPLRGCIGSLEAHRPLGEDIQANAVAAATRDPRFPPLAPHELADTVVEVCVLSAPAALPVVDEADLLARLRPGVDGVVLSACGRRATFLPQVWEQLPEPADFLAHLRRKAGLPADYWGPEVTIETYTVTAWQETAAGVPTGDPEGGRLP